MNANALQPFQHARPDARNHSHGQWIERRPQIVRCNHDQAVRFVEIRGNFCNELVAGNTDRGAEPGARPDGRLDLCGDDRCGSEQRKTVGDIEKRFVEREAFDQWGEFAKYLEHLFGHRLVMRHARRHALQLRAAPQRLADGHRRANAENPCFVTCGSNHAAIRTLL